MKNTSIEQSPSGFTVIIGGTPAKTPLGRDIVLPNDKIANAIAAEWQAQGKVIRKDTMPLTQIACVAVDLVNEKRAEVCADILTYSDTDVLCYRAGDIPDLLAQQTALLDPIIAWAKQRYGIELTVTGGVMPVAQHPQNKAKITAALAHYNVWQLAVFASVVKPFASIILALAMMERHMDAEQAFHLSHLEETYETGKWGEDTEKEDKINKLKQDVLAAETFLKLLSL